jgi:hypothetical protein
MKITVREVSSRYDLKVFIYLPGKIHSHEPMWVPPIYGDEFRFFDKNKNKYFSFCDTILLLAYEGDRAVGRVMGIINHRYNSLKNENNGRFAFLESYNNPEIVKCLLEKAESWAKAKGANKIVGPLGFSDKDPQGLLIDGFEYLPVISTNYNQAYMMEIIEALGYKKEKDLFSYHIELSEKIPNFYESIFNRTASNEELKLIEFKSRRQLRPWIRPVLTLINETYTDIYASMPFESDEMDDFANRYLAILHPSFIKALEKNGKLIAVIISVPDLSEGMQKAKGKLFPFGFIKILYSQKRTKRLVLLLGGIRDEYRGLGYDTYLGVKILEESLNAGLTHIDSHLILEENVKMRAEVEKLGGRIYKRYRIYQKSP